MDHRWGWDRLVVCSCQHRQAFHAALCVYHHAWQPSSYPPRHSTIDYAVDFERIARHRCRELGEEYLLVLECLYLRRGCWHSVAGRSDIPRHRVFRLAHKVEAEVGRELCDLRPFPLYPVVYYTAGRPGKVWPTKHTDAVWRIPPRGSVGEVMSNAC